MMIFGKFFRLSEKNFKALEYECATYHLKAPDLKISNILFKYRDSMYIYIFRENRKSAHKIPKFEYFPKVITYSKSPDHVLQSYI